MAKQSQVKSRRKLLNPVFHLQTKEEDDSQLTQGMIKVVRKTGQLNLSGRSLASVPQRMFSMYERGGDEVVVEIDFNKQDTDAWWNFKPLTYLDLSSNVLQEIPSQISMFEDLTTLNLQDNSLTTLPPEIGMLRKLTRFNASHNKISLLPEEFYKLTELQVLLLSHNCLEVLSRGLSDLIMLQQLDLSHNKLIELPSGIGFLVRLTDVNFSHNNLKELPPDIVNLRGLLKLDVTHNNLKFLPKLGELRRLQILYAQHNDIEELPDFEGCEHIHELFFGNNYIKEIPADFCENMPNLKILDLRDNKLESIPEQIVMLQHVIRIDLTNNELTGLPNTLGLLPHLQNLQIEGNAMKNIRSDVIKGGTHRILKHLRDKLEEVEVASIPRSPERHAPLSTFPDKYQMCNLRALNLTMKDLTNVPDAVFEEAQKAEVTIVDLCKNKFSEVPKGLLHLVPVISELNLSMNQLKAIPDFLGDCLKLQYLDLGRNYLTDLPESLKMLQALRELVLSNNRFSTIPQCVFEMQGLEILLLGDNQITDICIDGLSRLKRLATLDLSNNNIGQVPPELGNMKQLRSLELKGNRFRQPRYAILEQGTDAILSYLRDKIPQ